MMNWKTLSLSFGILLLLAACSSTKPADTMNTGSTETPSAAPVYDSSTSQSAATANGASSSAMDVLNDPNSPLAKRSVYFAFDSSSINQEGQSVVEVHSAYLKAHSNQKVVIQGNTDARGSREYNLALGQRRSESVKKAMEVLGVPEQQVEAVSFGKEKPKALGHTAADYAENRRADIVY